jgi:disulfide bond formation protein DsbB
MPICLQLRIFIILIIVIYHAGRVNSNICRRAYVALSLLMVPLGIQSHEGLSQGSKWKVTYNKC